MSPLKIKTILVVDNDSDTRNFIARLAGEIGCQAITAKNGQEALELSINAGPFDAIVANIHMPHHIDGLELAKIVRHSKSDLPIILIHSGLGKPGQYSKAHLVGITDYVVQKPIIGDQFKSLLSTILADPTEGSAEPASSFGRGQRGVRAKNS